MEFEDFIEFENEGLTSQIYHFNSFLKRKIIIKFEEPFFGQIFFYFPHLKKCFWINLFSCSQDYFIFDEIEKEFIIGFSGSLSKFTVDFEDYENLLFLDLPFYSVFNQKNIKQVYVSYSLKHLREKIRQMYHLKYYYNKKKPLLVFGVYENNDKKIIKEHQGDVYIIWGGSDIMIKKSKFDYLNKENIFHFCLSSQIKKKCLEFGFNNVQDLFLTFCFGLKPYLYPLKNKRKGIYIYDGLTKNRNKNKIYNQSLIDKLVPKLNKYEIYRSSDLEFSEKIWETYQKCFIGIRLTIHDGNANQIQECGLLGIPCISHQEMNHCLSWNNLDEIIFKINFIYQNNIVIKFNYPQPKILIISGDKPGNGGGATSSFRLSRFLSLRGFEVSNLYLNHVETKEPYFKGEVYNFNMNSSYNVKDFIPNLNYDVVILRTAINNKSIEYLRDNFFKIYFFIPGVYKNECSEKSLEYIHKMNIRQCQLIPSLTNSRLSKFEISVLGFDCQVLEHNLLLLDNEMIINKEIEWDCVFIASNLNRPIKNVELALNLLNFFGKRNWKTLVITNDEVEKDFQKKYKHVSFIKGIAVDEMKNYYLKTRVVINTSYFDSMSNVLLEAINYGCHILCSSQNGLVDYIEDKEKFVVFDYDLENWKTILRKTLKQFDKQLEDRKKLFNSLLKKKWEVEIKLLELLYV